MDFQHRLFVEECIGTAGVNREFFRVGSDEEVGNPIAVEIPVEAVTQFGAQEFAYLDSPGKSDFTLGFFEI